MSTVAKLWKFLRWVFFILVAIVAVQMVASSAKSRMKLNVTEHLSEVVFVLDNEEVTLEDIMFYILLEEYQVEKQAAIYNPDNSKQFWNVHTNGVFVSVDSKDAVLSMAVHDRLMYRQAIDAGLDFTEAEKSDIENRRSDFWENLYDYQLENLVVSKDVINAQFDIAAMSEKYTNILAKEAGVESAPFGYDGYYFEQILKEHELKVNDRLWDKVVLGDITLSHKKQFPLERKK